jgi:type VI secretion system protein ImpB
VSKESIQKKLSRVRPPRVHITYDVETGGAIEKREIPFVVGVLADLAGNPETPQPPLKDRKFIEIDRDNFDEVMARIGPRLAYKVDNRLRDDDTQLGVELRFKSLDDFAPAAVVKQIPPLRKLLELRSSLQNLRSTMIGNDRLESLLMQVVSNTEALQRIKAESVTRSGRIKAVDSGEEV